MKRCPTCKGSFELEAFPRNRGTKDGRGTYCKPCHNARTRDTAQRLYGGSRSFLFKRRYGITAEQVDLMIRVQGGRCAICERAASKLQVDHDHVTGLVRGMLCFNCNAGLGQVSDSVGHLKALLAYRSRFA